MSLDEVSEESLRAELEMRKGRRARGVCDYCGRGPGTPTCRFPQRHNPVEPVAESVEWKKPAAEWLRTSDQASTIAHTAFVCEDDVSDRAWELMDTVLASLADALDPKPNGAA